MKRLYLIPPDNNDNREEMVENLGCIARSGSKAFMEQFKAGGQQDPKVIFSSTSRLIFLQFQW